MILLMSSESFAKSQVKFHSQNNSDNATHINPYIKKNVAASFVMQSFH